MRKQDTGEIKRAAESAALAKQRAEIDLLLESHGCDTAAGYDWSPAVLEPGGGEPVSLVPLSSDENPASLSLGISEWSRHTATDGRIVYVHRFGNAAILHAPRDLVERAWDLLQSVDGWPGYREAIRPYMASDYTAEEARRFLAEYRVEEAIRRQATAEARVIIFDRPVAGWQARAHIAGRLDLLIAGGVLPSPPPRA